MKGGSDDWEVKQGREGEKERKEGNRKEGILY